jgi:hypothetical protein
MPDMHMHIRIDIDSGSIIVVDVDETFAHLERALSSEQF